MNRIDIQILDVSNNWRTVNSTFVSTSSAIRKSMENASRQYTNSRVRAVDGRGFVVDIL